jgi:hypothetical protein
MIWLCLRHILYDTVIKPIIIRGIIYGIEGANGIIKKTYKKKEAQRDTEKENGG